MNYKDLLFWIQHRQRKLFLSNQLYLVGSKKSLNGSIQPLSKLSVVEVNFDISQDEEENSKRNIHANICQ